MGFEIGKKVQSGDITLDQLRQKLNGDKLQQKAATIFKQFNTNQTANEAGDQVLDTTEQVALMSFFKEIAGGKKSDADDKKVSRRDLRHFKKENQKNSAMSFVNNLGYKDMKKIMSAFTGVVEADASEENNDNLEITGYRQDKEGGVRYVDIGRERHSIDKDNRVISAGSEAYTYGQDGKLTEKKDGNKTTTFKNGVRAKETTTSVYIEGQNCPVNKGEVFYNGVYYPVKDGKVIIGEKEYPLNTNTTTYSDDGRTKTQDVVLKNGVTTTTDYQDDGETLKKRVIADSKNDVKTTIDYTSNGIRQKQVVADNKNKITTTTRFQADGEKKAREEVVDNSNNKRTTTIFTPQGDFRSREIKEGNKTTTIDYAQRTQTINDGDVTTVETFNEYNSDGSVDSKDSNISKRVVTDTKDHTRTTTEPSENQARTIELLDDNNSTVQRKVTFENGEAKITVGGKTITLKTDKDGNILGNRKCKGLRMETVEEAVVRLGYKKGSAEYKAIIDANKGNKGAIKIPADVANLRGLNTDTAVVDAAAERRQLNRNIVAHREQNRASYGQQAFNTYNKKHPNAKLRGTWASTSKQVYCTEDANIGGKGYNQHYIYDAASNGLVKLESYLNLGKGKYVDRITEDGHARIQPGNKLVKIDIKKRTTTASSAAEYNSSFESSVRKGAKGDISGTVNPTKHQYVYYGSDKRKNVVVAGSQMEFKTANGTWETQAQIDNGVSVATNAPATKSRQNMPTSTLTGHSPSATGNQTWHDIAPRDNTYVKPAINPITKKIPVKAPGPKPDIVTISWVKYSSGGNSNTPTATVNGVRYTGSAGGVSFSPGTRRNANIKDLKDQITKIYGDGIKFVMSNEV